jgi:predicted nucleic acid-binding protein
VIAPDSSVLVAGFAPSHRFHRAVLPSLAEVAAHGSLIAHTIAETYSVLSAPGGIYRAEPGAVVSYLDQFLAEDSPIPVLPAAYREALDLLAANGRPGGAVYDALIALAARDAKVILVSLDGRAAPTYELCGVDARLLADAER